MQNRPRAVASAASARSVSGSPLYAQSRSAVSRSEARNSRCCRAISVRSARSARYGAGRDAMTVTAAPAVVSAPTADSARSDEPTTVTERPRTGSRTVTPSGIPAPTQHRGDQGRAAVHPELALDVVQVELHGGLRDEQGACDRAVVESLDEQPDDLALTPGERARFAGASLLAQFGHQGLGAAGIEGAMALDHPQDGVAQVRGR